MMGQIGATIVNTTPRPRGSKHFQATDFYREPWKKSGVAGTLSPKQLEFINRRKRNRETREKAKRAAANGSKPVIRN
jgi:hypothetical protein